MFESEGKHGNYTVTLCATDSKGAVNQKDAKRIITILPLSDPVMSNILRRGNGNRRQYNLLKSGTPDLPWAENTFLAGERFLLGADTTMFQSGALDYASQVIVTTLSNGKNTSLSKNGDRWTGGMGFRYSTCAFK